MVPILSRAAQENLIGETKLPNNSGLESIAQLVLSVFKSRNTT